MTFSFVISFNPTDPHCSNCEELVIQGPESKQDLRQVNSYPSKVISSWRCPQRLTSVGMRGRPCRYERVC